MKVYIKHRNTRRYCIPVPLPIFLLRTIFSSPAKRLMLKHIDEKSKKYVENVDFDALITAIGDIKKYKGLRLVEVTTSKGEEVIVVI